jgi:hypothetical protein
MYSKREVNLGKVQGAILSNHAYPGIEKGGINSFNNFL